MEKTMKNLTALALILALPFVASAQRQTFNLPAYFTTNVFLQDNTNTPLHTRIANAEATNASGWAGFPASSNADLDGFGATNVAFIGFDTDYTNGIAEGRLQWNTDAEKLEFGLVDGELTHKIGDATIMRVRAAENILKGQVVSASGQTGGARPNVVLADADSTNLIRRVPTGIALQNINNNASGYILTGGLGDAFDTTGFPTDTPLFLSTTAGGLTTNKPGYPLDAFIVGESVLSNALTGQFVVNIAPCKQWQELEDRYVVSTNLPAGIVTTNNLSTIAGSGLGVESNRLVVTNAPNAATTNMLTNYLALAGGTMSGNLDMGDGNITNVQTISSSSSPVATISLADDPPVFLGNWRFLTQPIIPGYVTTNGSAANLTNFPSSILTVSAGNAAYWRITTAPTSSTASAASGRIAVEGTNLYIYSPNALGTGTGRWGRVGLDVSW
jgi:hypothetical protein